MVVHYLHGLVLPIFFFFSFMHIASYCVSELLRLLRVLHD